MSRDPLALPDVLVLGGGGIVGEAWMTGLLAGVEAEAGIDFRDCEHFVGTSAGSIVSARLAAGRRPWLPELARATRPDAASSAPRGLGDTLLETAVQAAALAATPLAPAALAVTARGGALARALALSRAPRPGQRLDDLGDRIERWGTRLDGRLRLVAVDRESGRRVVFGAPGAPHATASEAVQASCAVPWIFAPVTIGGREYVDGGVWSPTSLDVAPAGRDAQVLCLFPTGSIGRRTDTAIARLALIMRPVVVLEELAVRRRGARVRVVAPDDACADAMGLDFMDAARRVAVIEAGYAQGRALA